MSSTLRRNYCQLVSASWTTKERKRKEELIQTFCRIGFPRGKESYMEVISRCAYMYRYLHLQRQFPPLLFIFLDQYSRVFILIEVKSPRSVCKGGG